MGLFRYALIRTAADPALTTKQRGRLVRELAGPSTPARSGSRCGSPGSRSTAGSWSGAAAGSTRWCPRPARVQPRTAAAVLELAAALKREAPARTAAQVARDPARLRRHAAPRRRRGRCNATSPAGAQHPPRRVAPRAFGRFEAAAPNDRWTGDALHGPVVAGRKTNLFAFIDDHSRAVVGTAGVQRGHRPARSGAARRARLAGCPRRRLRRQRVRDGLQRSCAGPGGRWGSGSPTANPASPPGGARSSGYSGPSGTSSSSRSATRGPRRASASLAELNSCSPPGSRRLPPAGPHRDRAAAPGSVPGRRPPVAANPPQLLREAFLWSEWRTVTKTATSACTATTTRSTRRWPAEGRAGVRPVRPHRHRRPPSRPARWAGGPAPDRPPRPPQGRHRPPTAAATDRDRLPRLVAEHTARWSPTGSTTRTRRRPQPPTHPEAAPPTRPVHHPGRPPGQYHDARPDDLCSADLARSPGWPRNRASTGIPGQLDLTDLTNDPAPRQRADITARTPR